MPLPNIQMYAHNYYLTEPESPAIKAGRIKEEPGEEETSSSGVNPWKQKAEVEKTREEEFEEYFEGLFP